MKKTTLFALATFLSVLTAKAQSTSCDDMNGYPQSKNVSSTGAYTLTAGVEENAAQTYHYAGPGKITGVRISGSTPNLLGVDLIARVYNVDANGRPSTIIGTRHFTWYVMDNILGYKDVSFTGGGYNISNNFAVSVELDGGFAMTTKFQVKYNGNGEGRGEDLASLAGTSTGFNWASAMTGFSRDGDFYIVPKMKNFITSEFTAGTTCANTNTAITFANTSKMSTDSMFNKIGLSSYNGTQFFYTWNFGDASPVSHVVNPTHTYVTAGTYTVTLTCTLEGWVGTCTNSTTRKVSIGLNASVSNQVNVNCAGSSTGSLTAVGTGGATPYSYSIDGNAYQPNANFSNLAAGVHTVNVKDVLGCIKSTSVTITQPLPITIATPLTTNSSCGTPNGAIQASATGGTGVLQYSIDGINFQTSGLFQNILSSGYTVTVKDANGCTSTASAIVSDLGSPTLTIVSYTNVSCNGLNNGSIIVSGSGGVGQLMYSINGNTYQVSGTFNNVAAGVYFVTVRDAAGCKSTKVVTIGQPSALSFTTAMVPATCNGTSTGQILVTSVIGGTGNMSYSLNGVNYQSSPTFSGLAAGIYSVYVKDAAGCALTMNVTVTQPTAVTATITSSNASCNNASNASITVVASGGTPGYTYSIDGEFYPTGDFSELTAGTYTVVVMDDNGCAYNSVVTLTQPTIIAVTVTTGNSTCGNANGTLAVTASGGSGSGYQYSINGTTWNSSGAFSGLTDSTYAIIVTDGAGCTNVFHATISDANGPMINTISSTNIVCNGSNTGTITVTNVTGGSGTLYYNVDGSPWQLSTIFTGLSAGPHVVIVHDGLWCTGSYTAILTEPAPIVVTATVINLTCNGDASGSATITAAGGSGQLAYSIDYGDNWQSSNVITNLQAGTYPVLVRDAGGCVGETTITVTQPDAISVINNGLNVTCAGAGDGAIFVTAFGGTGVLSYSLNGNTYQSNGSFTGLNGGVYIVYVKDANGCVRTSAVNINEPQSLGVSANVYNITCAGGNDGVIDINISGGTAPYSTNWSNTASTEDVFNLTAGTYSVVITDANGCTFAAAYTVTQPANPLVVNAIITNATDNTTSNGAVDITITGGTPPYTYSWSNGNTTQDLSGVLSGSYIVTITDANGCVTSGVYTVNTSTGIHDVSGEIIPVKLYPNPATEFLTLEADGNIIARVELMNLVGELVFVVEPKTSKVDINLAGLAEGVYFVKLKVNDTFITKKVEVLKH